MKTNEIEVEVNGNKVTITLTDEQIKQLQTPKKREWYDEIKYEQFEYGDNRIIPIRYSHKGYSIIPIWDSPIFTNDEKSCYCLNADLLNYGSNPQKAHIFNNNTQAKITVEYINLFIEMYNFCQLRNGANKIEWGNGNSKYILRVYGIHNGSYSIHVERFTTDCIGVFGLAVLTKEHAEEMLSIFGDRIKEVYSKLQNY